MDCPSLPESVSVSRTTSPTVRRVKWVMVVVLEMHLKVDSSSDDVAVVVVVVVVAAAAVDNTEYCFWVVLVSMQIRSSSVSRYCIELQFLLSEILLR